MVKRYGLLVQKGDEKPGPLKALVAGITPSFGALTATCNKMEAN
jgi:hypothetical protein